MRTGVRHHHLHRHGDVQRIIPRPEGATRIGVPQPVRPVPQPRPAGPAPEPEEPRVRRHLRPLHPPCRTPLGRLPPARRQITPQQCATGRAQLHGPLAGHHHRGALRHHPPAALLVGLKDRPRVRLGTPARLRVRRSGSAPSHPQKTAPPVVTRTRSSDRANRTTPPAGPGLHLRHGTRHAARARCAAAPALSRPPATCAMRRAPCATPAPCRPCRPPSPNAPGHDRSCCSPCHRKRRMCGSFNCRSPGGWHLTGRPTGWVTLWCGSRSRGIVLFSRVHAHTQHVRTPHAYDAYSPGAAP